MDMICCPKCGMHHYGNDPCDPPPEPVETCETCKHWTEFVDTFCFGRCAVSGGGTSDWFSCKRHEGKQ